MNYILVGIRIIFIFWQFNQLYKLQHKCLLAMSKLFVNDLERMCTYWQCFHSRGRLHWTRPDIHTHTTWSADQIHIRRSHDKCPPRYTGQLKTIHIQACTSDFIVYMWLVESRRHGLNHHYKQQHHLICLVERQQSNYHLHHQVDFQMRHH